MASIPATKAFGRDELSFRMGQGLEMAPRATPASSGGMLFGPGGVATVRAQGQAVQYRIDLAGIQCLDDTGDRFFGSDEPYVIFTITDGFRTWSKRTDVYGDVDTGEVFGPKPALLSIFGERGPEPAKQIALVVSVMENDDGDPDKHKNKVRAIVEGARAVAAAAGLPLPSWVGTVATEVVNFLLASGDDEVQTVNRVIEADDLETLSRAQRTVKNIKFNTSTLHSGGGGRYRVMLKVSKITPPTRVPATPGR
jgi:hypothetical protein